MVSPIEIIRALFIATTSVSLLVIFVVYLVRTLLRIGDRSTHSGSDLLESTHPSTTQGAIDTLEERFAKGEIDSEEFNERRNQLMRDSI